MRRNLLRNLLFLLAVLVLISASLAAVHFSVHADSQQRLAVSGSAVPLLPHAQRLQAADPQQNLRLAVALRLRDQEQLDNLLSAIYNPHSALYHHYLSSAEFDARFAPSLNDVQTVVAFLQAQGLRVGNIASNHLLIEASGPVAQVERAFQVQINNYRLGTRTFFANTAAPTVPAALSQLITSITGLDNSVQYHPSYQRLAARSPNATPSGYGPQDLSGAYDATPLQSAGTLGDNQTVAVFELDGYQQGDLNQYFQTYNLGKPSIKPVLVGGASGTAGQGAIEVELDLEVIAAMAPHANQLVYEGPNTTLGLNQTYNQIVSDNQAKVVSTSWGLCEAGTGNAELNTLDSIFKSGAAKGISFFAAAGDSGAYDCNDNKLAVDSPADDPYVTGVGGTNLQLNNGGYGSESVWSNANDTQRSPNGAGGGGGFSIHFQQPAWQNGPGTGSQNNGMRQVPDVAANADPASGYAVYCTVSAAGCPSTGWVTVGGTSAAAPLWAGSTALLNQFLQAQGKSPVGTFNPAIYQLFNANQTFPAFHDVTSGTNLFYQAGAGYDMASGIGSPDLYNLARDLAGITGGGDGGGGTPTPTPNPGPSGTSFQNGGFENGQNPWQEGSGGGYQLIDTTKPHSGTHSVYLCGYVNCTDRIWQNITLPDSFNQLTLTYWWYAASSKTTHQCLDTFTARILNSAGTVLRTLQHSCNTDAANDWAQLRFDLTGDLAALKGGTFILSFQGTTAPRSFQTSNYFLDDVAIDVA